MSNNQEEILETKFQYKIIKKVGEISKNSKGFTKEINIISYNDREPVLDIRIWTPSGTMLKGVTLKKEEIEVLKELLKNIK